MTAYAVAHLRSVTLGADIVSYLERIDATLAPFQGRFLVHGGARMILLSEFSVRSGRISCVFEFPDREGADHRGTDILS